MAEVLSNLLYKLVDDFGLQILYVASYVLTMIYVFALRKKENEAMLKTIQDQINAYKLLSENIQSNMRYMAIVTSALAAAFDGKKSTAAKILKGADANLEESDS